MRAVGCNAFGDGSVLVDVEVEKPQVGDDELLVEVFATALNPVDTKIRRGYLGERTFPCVLGFDVSGVVREMGKNVRGFNIGDEVFTCPTLFRAGSNAEFVVVDYRRTALKPKSLSHAEAAAVPLVAVTAFEALEMKAKIHAGQTVLIQAGAGGVGHFAIQIAKLKGCRVLTTASTAESIEFCRKLGADEVINYKTEDVVQRVLQLTGGQGVDVAMDNVGSTFETSVRCARAYGEVVTIAGGDPSSIRSDMGARSITWHMEFMDTVAVAKLDPSHQGEILRKTADLLDSGRLRVHVSHTFDLNAESVRKAHAQQESGSTMGKIVIRVK